MADCRYNDQYTLPEPPSGWNQAIYPNGVILYLTGTAYYLLVCCDTEFTAKTVDGVQVIAFPPWASCYRFLYNRADDDWGAGAVLDPAEYDLPADSEWVYIRPDKAEWIWCNNDIKDESGTDVYAGSEPVPIEEPPIEEPDEEDTWLRDFKIGLALGLSGKGIIKRSE